MSFWFRNVHMPLICGLLKRAMPTLFMATGLFIAFKSSEGEEDGDSCIVMEICGIIISTDFESHVLNLLQRVLHFLITSLLRIT